MKKTLAAFTAVALAVGLSLAAVVAPAQADDASTPAPVASTSADTTASSAPTSAPTPAVTPTPEATAPATVAGASAKSFSTTAVVVPSNPYAPCINDSLVTYTYSNNDSNSGDITVPTVAGSSGLLCKPFYVTATSWKYTSNAVWPQVVDKVNHVNGTPVGTSPANIAIAQSGVYHYAAQITCGQGDIYASFTATDATLFPENDNPGGTGILTNPGTPLPEHFLSQMGFSGTYPTYRQDSTNCWTPTPETGVPTTSTLTCAKDSSNTLTLPAVPGGVWTVTNGSGASSYNHTYAISTGVTGWVPTNFTGTYTVTLKDGSSTDAYTVTGTSTPWAPQNPSTLDCSVVTTVVGDCIADGTVSTVPVGVTLDNSTGPASSKFVVKIEGTSASYTFVVPAHTKWVNQSIGSAPTTGEKADVFVNDSTTPVVLTIASFDGCIPVSPGDPTFTPLTCTSTTVNLGSISTDGNPGLKYTLDGPGHVATVFPSLPSTPTISGLVAGDYTVSVVQNPGYILTGTTEFPVHIPLAAVNCVGTQQTPVVTFVQPTCTPNPANIDLAPAGFTTALTEVQGTITIPDDTLMSFTISNGTTTTAAPTGQYIEPDGTYTVVATLRATPIANGYTFGPSAAYTRSAGNTVATFTAIAFTSQCGLPTLASWHSGAAGDPATCTLTGGALGTITVVHGSDAAHPTDENGKVTYTLVNNGNGHTTNLGSTVSTVNVAPGSYTVEATPTDPADGLVGNTNATNEIDYSVTVAAPAGSCGDRLAFTGGTIAWFGFVLAGGMLFLGIAFLLIRRRGNRTAE